MRDIWDKIERWLKTNAPRILESLGPPASNEEIDRAQSTLGVTFPEEVRQSFLIHNGQREAGGDLHHSGTLLSLGEMVRQWGFWKELLDGGEFKNIESKPQPEIRKDWWNAAWIPITHDGGGNHQCLDLAPASKGKTGQIITMWHDGPERELIATSFRGWLGDFEKKLEAGELKYSEDYGRIMPLDMA